MVAQFTEEYFSVRCSTLTGSSLKEVKKKALLIYSQIKSKTKRRPYIRSKYFKKRKIFFDYFWIHISQKREQERIKRLKFFNCAIELIIYTRKNPISKVHINKKTEIFHRFYGITINKVKLVVQVKENIKTKKLYFMSVFRWK